MSKNIPEQLLTLRDFMRWGASRFREAGLDFGHGTASAIDEAVYLALHAVHLPPNTHASWFDTRLVQKEKRQIISLFERRIGERIPAAYITHEAWFAGLDFYVDERVLIPRSPLAELIEQGFEPWVDATRIRRILDLGTGSGCIGIACAYAFPEASVDLADISPDALAVAEINLDRHKLRGRVRTIETDLFANIEGEYDLIVSNPPYVDREDMACLTPEFAHEPPLGLEAGEDGLDVVLPLLKGARDHLAPEGVLVVEVGNSEAALSRRLPNCPLTWIEFEHGGHGVFTLNREQLLQYECFDAVAE